MSRMQRSITLPLYKAVQGGGIDVRPLLPHIASNVGDNSASARSANRFITRNG